MAGTVGGAAVAGALVGNFNGPIGAIVGGIAGAVGGGIGGHYVGEAVVPSGVNVTNKGKRVKTVVGFLVGATVGVALRYIAVPAGAKIGGMIGAAAR